MAEVLEPEAQLENTNENIVIEENKKQEELKQEYIEQTTFEKKPSLWQRFKNSKFVRAIRYVMKIRVVLDYPALPEGNNQN